MLDRAPRLARLRELAIIMIKNTAQLTNGPKPTKIPNPFQNSFISYTPIYPQAGNLAPDIIFPAWTI